MKVVNLFIGSFVISSLTLNSDVLAGCCGNKNNKGNNNSSNNNGSKQTPPSKKSNSTTTTTSGAGLGAGLGATTTTTNTTGATSTGLGAGFGAGFGAATSGAKAAATTTTTPEATTTGAGLGAATTTTGAATTVTHVNKTTEIQDLGGIKGLTARLQGSKIYLSINNQIFMENVDTYNNDSIDQESIKNVKMKFSNDTSLASLPIYNGSGITIGVIVMYIKDVNNIPLKDYLSEHNLMYGQFGVNISLVIDLTTFMVYREFTMYNLKYYFAYAQDRNKKWNYGFYYFTPSTGAYGYYNSSENVFYWSNADGSSIKTPNGSNQYNFYKLKFESHTIDNYGYCQA